jgi:hypothetical protein
MASANTIQAYLERYALLSLEKHDNLEPLTNEPLHELDIIEQALVVK